MNIKKIIFGGLICVLSFGALAATQLDIPKDLADQLEEAKLNCNEFRPNLITKFIWREGPTRSLLYKKCLDQTSDDENFNKYSDLLVKGVSISELSSNIDNIKTRLTFFTLANSLKIYLTNEQTSEGTIELVKVALQQFKKHYSNMKETLDKEVVSLKKKEKRGTEKSKELMNIIVTSEDELDKKIDKTLKYIDFILKNHNTYVEMHNKFFPKIYVEPKYFYKARLSIDECQFLQLNFEEDWWRVKKKFKIYCVVKKEEEKNVKR